MGRKRVGLMDLEAARSDLVRAATGSSQSGPRFAAARLVLVNRGVEAVGMALRPGISLDEIVRIAIDAPSTEARRAFAVLLVHAFGIPGLLPSRGPTADAIMALLERALLNPLRRAGYPFDGSPYDKRQAVAVLHATIDEHLRPPEPSIPRWLHGLARD